MTCRNKVEGDAGIDCDVEQRSVRHSRFSLLTSLGAVGSGRGLGEPGCLNSCLQGREPQGRDYNCLYLAVCQSLSLGCVFQTLARV